MQLIFRCFILLVFLPLSTWAQTTGTADKVEKKIDGDAGLLTDYVWHGLTQTKRNPAIQSSLYYHLGPNLRLGAWGSNVSYYGRSKANALLKLQADISLNFTENVGMGIHFSDNHYFESDDRDGNTFGLDFDAFGYNFLLEQEGNWQGTVSKARYYGVRRTWDVFGRWKWENQAGFTQFENMPSLSDYLDFRTAIGTATGLVFWQAGLTFTNNNTQFGDACDYFFVFSAKARF
jgi:uncharacterized protein (TIGR02001 family)